MPSGVYKITCSVTGKVYVGSSQNLRTRWRIHRNELSRGVHKNARLQRAWRKYGKEVFNFAVLEYVPSTELLNREQHWIDQLRAVEKGYGFNIRPRAESNRGFRHRRSSKQKIKAGVSRLWVVRSPAGDEQQISNLRSFCRQRHLDYRGMNAVANGEYRHHKGWHCRKAAMTYAAWQQSLKTKTPRAKQRQWFVISPTGCRRVVQNLPEFCRKRDLNHSLMIQVARGRYPRHKGWGCEYVGEVA